MDDPWGSPWADETPEIAEKPVDAKPKPTIVPAKPQPFDSATKSPWDEDEDFGEWAALPGNATQESPHATIKYADDDWNFQANEGQEAQGEEVTTANDIDSPWTTPSNEPAKSSPLKPQGVSGEEKHDLHDPWAQSTQDEQLPHEEAGGSGHNAAPDTSNLHGRISGDTDTSEEQWLKSDLEVSSLPHETPSQETTSKIHIAEPFPLPMGEPDLPSQDSISPSLISDIPEKEASQSSRPSLSLSDRSPHHETVADSPRTSVEEETRRPTLESVDSSKVKQLVQLFDGLAVELPIARDESKSTDSSSDTSEHTSEMPSVEGIKDEFGDFEDGVSYVSATENSNENNVVTSIPNPIKTSKKTEGVAISHQEPLKDDMDINSRNSIRFDIDKSVVNQLYPAIKTLPQSTSYGPSEIENPILDSFSTVEQRKVWYRISRYGTMRKYNAGEDDNYVRIDWNHSKVREETLKIVQKWMEQDRIGGGLIHGGGGRLESMFSWGKPGQAPVVEALPRAGLLGHRTSQAGETFMHSSMPPSEHKLGHSRQQSSVGSTKSIPSSPAEVSSHFSWSTSQPMSTSSGASTGDMSTRSHPHPSHSRKVSAISPVSNAFEQSHPLPIQPLQPQPITVDFEDRNKGTLKAEENDEEWGEMVSSPITPSFPKPPIVPPANRRHKYSHSIMGVLDPSPTAKSHGIKHFRNASLGHQMEDFKPESSKNMAPSFVPQEPGGTSLGGNSKSAAHSDDAWAGADFSFFESPSTESTGLTGSGSLQSLPKQSSPALKPLSARADVSKRFHEPANQIKVQPPSAPRAPNVGRRTKEEIEQDRIVKDIIQGLPDLSYMLR